jgi:hypothetical protein
VRGFLAAACLVVSACAGLGEERACRTGMARLETAIATWQGAINAKTEAEAQLDFADGAADFGRWAGCNASLRRGFRALGQTV